MPLGRPVVRPPAARTGAGPTAWVRRSRTAGPASRFPPSGWISPPSCFVRKEHFMPTTTEFAPGTPCWVDLSTSDLDAARGFYGTVLGWNDFEVAPAEAGYYTMALVDGQRVAGMMTASDDERAMAVPPHWNTYVCTTSADDSAERAQELGGTVVAGPFDVLDVGRMAVVLDREGAAISVWEPRAHPGFGLLRQ